MLDHAKYYNSLNIDTVLCMTRFKELPQSLDDPLRTQTGGENNR